MKEIVERILKEEEIARTLIEKTKKDAQGMVLKAQKDSKELLDKIADNIKNTTSQKTKEAESNFLAERKKILEETQNSNTALRKSREKDIAAISKEMFLKIIDIKS